MKANFPEGVTTILDSDSMTFVFPGDSPLVQSAGNLQQLATAESTTALQEAQVVSDEVNWKFFPAVSVFHA